MLTSISRIGKIAFAKAAIDWNTDLDSILEILLRHFDHFNGNGFYAHPNEVQLRNELARVPALAHFTEGLLGLRTHGAVIYNLGLAGLPEDRRNAALYALTLMLGYPTSTDQRTGRVAWDVRARPIEEIDGRFTTFSERIGRADMHTDSSFYPMPEEQFILYVVNAARCDGGHSLLVDGEDIFRGPATHRGGSQRIRPAQHDARAVPCPGHLCRRRQGRRSVCVTGIQPVKPGGPAQRRFHDALAL